MANEKNRYRAIVKLERLDDSRAVISTTVVATGLENLKRKVTGVIELMEEGDIQP